MNCLSLFVAVLAFTTLHGQTPKSSCDCPQTIYAETKADTAFRFSNGRIIALCGYKNTDDNPISFSEFVLAVCGQDTVIDFWDATNTCRLNQKKDTLIVQLLQYLPTGKNFELQQTVWAIEKIYFSGEKVKRNFGVNREIPKYNKEEIKKVLASYESAKPGLDDDKMEIANKLFVAAISGDKKARRYFEEFRTKFGELDGHFSEEYSELVAMLELWDAKR